ncbi:DUF2062 domain-containing protein [Candidatus Dependentiae bacterium]
MGVKRVIKKATNRLKKFFKALVLKERSPKVLAMSFCVGVFIAFSPFVGLHTAMIFLISWLFSLNFAVTLSASLFINNPWTMAPVYSVDYFFGEWFFNKLLGLNSLSLNPCWMEPLNGLISKYTGIAGISFWSFMVGGNLLGLLVSAILYPVVRFVFERMSENMHNKDTNKNARVKW